MRGLYINALGEEINTAILAEFTFFRGGEYIQMLVVEDRCGNPVMIRRDELKFMI